MVNPIGPDQQPPHLKVASALHKASMAAWKVFREAREELAVLGKRLHLHRQERHEEIRAEDLNRRV